MAARTRRDSLASVAATGDRRATLEVLRDRLARQIEVTDSARDVAALSQRLVDVLTQIADLPDTAEVSAADEIAKRRATRRTGAAGKTRPARSG